MCHGTDDAMLKLGSQVDALYGALLFCGTLSTFYRSRWKDQPKLRRICVVKKNKVVVQLVQYNATCLHLPNWIWCFEKPIERIDCPDARKLLFNYTEMQLSTPDRIMHLVSILVAQFYNFQRIKIVEFESYRSVFFENSAMQKKNQKI